MDEMLGDDFLIQNLLDAGLSQEEADQFMACYQQNRQVAQMQILNQYRGQLLGTVQDNQEKLYRLDYLIRRLKAKK